MTTKGQDEIKRLELEVKKLTRALNKERSFIERVRLSSEAKHQFSNIVLAERSRLERNMSLMLHHSTNMLLFFDADGIIDFCADLFLAFRGLAGFGLIKGQSLRELTEDFLPAEYISQVEDLLARHLITRQEDWSEAEQDAESEARQDSRSAAEQNSWSMARPDDGHSASSARSEAEPGAEPSVKRNAKYEEPLEFTCETQFQAYSNIECSIRDYIARAVLLINDKDEKDGLLIQIYDTTDFTRAKRLAEQANLAKSDFLATVSHEIRTPMNAIIGLADMMATTSLSEQQQEYLGKIQASSIAMLGLINDILDFSKIEADKLELIFDYFDLRALLNHMESMFETMMAQKHLRFTTEFDPNLPEITWGDDKRLRQVLTNILNNAYKYTPSGRVAFSVAPEGTNAVRFTVSDTGVGIKEDDIDKLFKEFEQLDMVRNKHVVGTGLGLAITKRLVEMMDGRIEVSSVYGEGSTFSVVVPLKQGTREDLPAIFDHTIEFVAPRARVLIVDDVEVNIEIAEFMLEPFEVQTEKAYDGLEAVHLVDEQHFDLVFMDQMMPTMDGMEATRRIREMEGPASRVPIVALTANAIQGMEAKFIEAGFDGFISKPIDAQHLAQTLYDFLPDELIYETEATEN